MAESLKDKTVKGIGWSAIDNVAQYIVSFVVGIILARLLSPDDYGLLGIIYIFTAISETIISGGFSNALIRKKNASEIDYSTAFTVNLGTSILLYLIIFVCSPFIAEIFHREELVSLIRVTSIGLILGAFSLVQQTRLTKNINFKSQAKITLLSSLVSGIIGISLALLHFGVWALVAQFLSLHFFRTVLLWIVNKWIPQLCFSKESFHSLFGFGWKMMVSGLIDTIWKQLYQIVIGIYYKPTALGQYSRAAHFANLCSSNLTNVIQRVSFPVLSNIQNDKLKMVDAYKKIIKSTMFITFISMFVLAAISKSFIYCLIGTKWHDAAAYLPIICISSCLYPLHAINLNMLQVLGRSDLFLGLEIIKKIIGIAPIVIGIFLGIVPMLIAGVFTSVIAYFLNSYYSGKFLGYSSYAQLRDIYPSFLTAIIISIPTFIISFLPLNHWILLPLQFLSASILFYFVCHRIQNKEWCFIREQLSNYFSKINLH